MVTPAETRAAATSSPATSGFLAEWISEERIIDDVLPAGIGGEIRMVPDPHSERTLPRLWIHSDMDTWRDECGLSKPGGLNHAPGLTFGAFDPERPGPVDLR